MTEQESRFATSSACRSPFCRLEDLQAEPQQDIPDPAPQDIPESLQQDVPDSPQEEEAWINEWRQTSEVE